MAAGILVKGPVLPVLAILTLAALCVWHRQIAWLSTLRASEWHFFAFAVMSAMGDFSYGRNRWRISGKRDKG